VAAPQKLYVPVFSELKDCPNVAQEVAARLGLYQGGHGSSTPTLGELATELKRCPWTIRRTLRLLETRGLKTEFRSGHHSRYRHNFGHFFKMPLSIFQRSELCWDDKLFITFILDRERFHGVGNVYCTLGYIAKEMGMSKSSAGRAELRVKSLGILNAVPKEKRTKAACPPNSYTVNHDHPCFTEIAMPSKDEVEKMAKEHAAKTRAENQKANEHHKKKNAEPSSDHVAAAPPSKPKPRTLKMRPETLQLYTVWTHTFEKKFPGIPCARWSPRIQAKMEELLADVGARALEDGMVYTIEAWEKVMPGWKAKPTHPDPALLCEFPKLIQEAVQWFSVGRAAAEKEAAQQQKRLDAAKERAATIQAALDLQMKSINLDTKGQLPS
jgi:hypothetical protein